MLNDVRDITLAKNGQVALVSYENKVCQYIADSAILLSFSCGYI